jgi:hypothetical protein
MEVDLAQRPDDGIERGITIHLTAGPCKSTYLHG